jgi:hypothetical protein
MLVKTYVDTNDARNIDSIFSAKITTDCLTERGFTGFFSWDSIPGDSSYPTDSIEVSLYTYWRCEDPRNPKDSLKRTLRCDTLGRYGYLRYYYPSDSINDTLVRFDTYMQIRIWDSTSSPAKVNTEHKYQFDAWYAY